MWQGPPEAINICPLLVHLEVSPGFRTVRTDLKLGGQKATTPYLRYVKDFQSTYTTFPYNKSKGHNVLTGIYDSFTAGIWSNIIALNGFSFLAFQTTCSNKKQWKPEIFKSIYKKSKYRFENKSFLSGWLRLIENWTYLLSHLFCFSKHSVST